WKVPVLVVAWADAVPDPSSSDRAPNKNKSRLIPSSSLRTNAKESADDRRGKSAVPRPNASSVVSGAQRRKGHLSHGFATQRQGEAAVIDSQKPPDVPRGPCQVLPALCLDALANEENSPEPPAFTLGDCVTTAVQVCFRSGGEGDGGSRFGSVGD